MEYGELFWLVYLIILIGIFIASFFTDEASGWKMRRTAGMMIVLPNVFVLNLACTYDKRKRRRRYW